MHMVYCSPLKHNLVDTAWIIILVFPPGHVLNYMGVSNCIICLPRFLRLCVDPCGLMANEWNRQSLWTWKLPNGLVATTKWWLDSHTFSHMITTNRVVCWLLIRVEVRPMTHAISPLGSVLGGSHQTGFTRIVLHWTASCIFQSFMYHILYTYRF